MTLAAVAHLFALALGLVVLFLASFDELIKLVRNRS